MEDAFYTNILHEGLAFFGSKLVNPKRKCFHEHEFKGLVSYFSTVRVPQDRRLEFETAFSVIDFLSSGERYLNDGKIVKVLRSDLFFAVTHALGYMLGDKLFYAMMSERMAKEELKRLFYDRWKNDGEPVLEYYNLQKRLRHIKIPKRM